MAATHVPKAARVGGAGAEATGSLAIAGAGGKYAANADPAGAPTLDPGTLPQTDEKPQVNTEHFRKLSQALFDAIQNDDAELALPYFFPKTAYAQVKAIKNPGQDWERRLVAAFRRDIHGYHSVLGPGARFVGLRVSGANTRFMKRGAEGNRLGYFRTTRASLTYADSAGRERALLVSSLISWRGQWYVVHLNGFQ
ncbi:MAG: hypothetical protein SFV15_04630 [Polyangiaceae bacterium]|nr:hypothetical protein [Polyangiaceae bacterium]